MRSPETPQEKPRLNQREAQDLRNLADSHTNEDILEAELLSENEVSDWVDERVKSDNAKHLSRQKLQRLN